MRRLLSSCLVTVIALLAFGSAAKAQDLEKPRGRQGYYMGLGLSANALQTWENGDSLGLWGGTAMSVRFGQLITRRLGLGLEFNSVGAKGKGQTAGGGGFGLDGHWAVHGDWALHGGVGIGFLQIENPNDPDEGLRGTAGAAYTLGVSRDFFVSQRALGSGGWSVTPALDVRYFPGDTVRGVAVMLGVQLLWWTGLPANQLDLPDADAYKKR